MQIRSTNADGFVHFGGSIWAGVNSSHGVEIYGASTGGVIQPVGDDTDIAITLRGKGAGGVQIGTGSTSPIVSIQRYLIQFSPAAMAASTASQSTITVTGLTTTAVLFFQPIGTNSSGLSMAYNYRVQCSTAAELRLTQQNITASTIGTGESTARGWLIAFQF